MPFSAGPFVTASSRPLRFRMRTDLVATPHGGRDRRYWAVKDPVSLRFFHLADEEFSILRLLDGQISLDELRDRFEAAFPPQRLSASRLYAFLRDLHRKGLIIADAAAQGTQLLKRRDGEWKRRFWNGITSVLAIRFRGFDAEPLVSALYPWLRGIFSPAALGAAALLLLAALLLVTVQFETLLARLPDFEAFFTASNALWLILLLAAAKLLHELGHALTLKHYGGECHEIGLMLLAFTPSLYCNVSDAWMLPSRRQRIAVTAAGMAVELVLAAAATLLWWFSRPGLFQMLCLDVMFLCSVSTVLFNGNPLLKYDGYYILADLTDTPNLGERAAAALRSLAARWTLGFAPVLNHRDGETGRRWLPAYALASLVYRWFVVLAFFWMLHRALEPAGFAVLANVLFFFVVAAMLAPVAVAAGTSLSKPHIRRELRPFRIASVMLLLIAGGAAFWFVPLPRSVRAPLVLEPHAATSVFATVPGRLEFAVEPGRRVERDEVLARLQNPELDLEFERTAGQARRQELRVAHLEARRDTDPSASVSLPAAREALHDLKEQLARRRDDLERLVLRAPVAGIVLPPPNHVAERGADGVLPEWSGTPLDPRNRAMWIDRMLFCRIGSPDDVEGTVLVEQGDVERVSIGQRVSVRLDQCPGELLEGTVVEIARRETDAAPREFQNGDVLPLRETAAAGSRLLEIRYEVRVRFTQLPAGLRSGGRGHAKIETAAEALGPRLLRAVRRTFRFSL